MSTEKQPELNDKQLVEKYIAMRDWIKAEVEACELRIAGAQNVIKLIEGELHRRLIERFGAAATKKSSSCDAGTFYTSKTLSTRVTDQAKFKEFVFVNNLRDGIAASVKKEFVEEYLETYKVPPPGVEATWVENINVRRA